MMWVNTPPAKQDDRLSRGQLHMLICYHCHWQHEDTHSHNVSITRGHTTKLALEPRVKALRLCPSERSHCLTFLSSKMTGGRVKQLTMIIIPVIIFLLVICILLSLNHAMIYNMLMQSEVATKIPAYHRLVHPQTSSSTYIPSSMLKVAWFWVQDRDSGQVRTKILSLGTPYT